MWECEAHSPHPTEMRDSAFKRALGAVPIGAGIAIEDPVRSEAFYGY